MPILETDMKSFFNKGRKETVVKILTGVGQIAAAGWLAEVIFFARLSQAGKFIAAVIIMTIFVAAIIVTPERSDE